MPNQKLQQTAAAILVPRDITAQRAAAAAEHGRYPVEMYIPPEVTRRIEKLGDRIGCNLSVVQCWKNEFRPGMYCRFRGVLHQSSALKIEVAGTLSVELTAQRDDEIDLFLFVNGQRVGLFEPARDSRKYLIGHGDRDLKWDYTDEGFDEFNCLDESYGNGGRVDASLAIQPAERDDEPSVG